MCSLFRFVVHFMILSQRWGHLWLLQSQCCKPREQYILASCSHDRYLFGYFTKCLFTSPSQYSFYSEFQASRRQNAQATENSASEKGQGKFLSFANWSRNPLFKSTKSEDGGGEKGVKHSKSSSSDLIAEATYIEPRGRCHKRTRSSDQSSQTDFHLHDDDEDVDDVDGLVDAKKEIRINEKSEEKTRTQKHTLHPVYICVLLILVGFNFAAFSTYYANSTIARKIQVKHCSLLST